MIQGIRQLFTNLKDNRGFTLLEACIVMAILGILATVAYENFQSSRTKALDSTALAETREMGTIVLNTFLDGSDVDLNHDPGDGSLIGAVDTSGNPRKPLFVLTSGLLAQVTLGSSSDWGGSGKGYFEAFVWHPNGTKTYYILVDDTIGETTFPSS